jgi:hypothetical protein
MQMIAAVVGWEEAVRVAWVPDDSVEVDDGIEDAAVANERIDLQARRLASRVVRHPAFVRRERAADDADAVRVGAQNDLIETELDARDVVLVRRLLDVVDAEKHDEIRDVALREDVGIESCEGAWTEDRRGKENPVAADSLVRDTESLSASEQASRQVVRPAVVAVGSRARPIGDRIPEGNDRSARRRQDVDAVEVVPMTVARRESACAGLIDAFAYGFEVGLHREEMVCRRRRGPGHVERDKKIALRCDPQPRGIADDVRAWRKRHEGRTRETEIAKRTGYRRRSGSLDCDARSGDRKRRSAEPIGQPDAHGRPPDTDVHDFAQRHVVECRLRICSRRCSAPRRDPGSHDGRSEHLISP